MPSTAYTHQLGPRVVCLGDIALHRGGLDQSEAYFLRSLDLRQKMNDPMGAAQTKGNLGLIYARQQAPAQKLIWRRPYAMRDLRI